MEKKFASHFSGYIERGKHVLNLSQSTGHITAVLYVADFAFNYCKKCTISLNMSDI